MKIARIFFSFLVVSLFALPAWGQTFTAPSGYDLIYSLDVKDMLGLKFDAGGNGQGYAHVPYTTNNSSESYGLVESIGYYYQLDNNWVWVSMDAFTGDTTKMGVPTLSSGATFQRYVNNLNYQWNAAGFNLGGTSSGSATVARGTVEFWPTNYGGATTLGASGASGTELDYDDSRSSGNYGSMQIHSLDATPGTVFALNRWGGTAGNGPFDVGIGTNSKNAATGGIATVGTTAVHEDWTFAQNSGTYATQTLDVYAKKFTFENVSDADDRAFLLSETAGGKIAYKVQLPETGGINYNSHVLIDDTATMRLPVESVAYYVEATRADGSGVEYVYASMEGLTINPTRVGMPLTGQFVHQKNVENLTVRSNVAGVTEVTNSPYGNVEIWRNQYNDGSNPGASPGTNPNLPKSDGKYDFNDYRTDNPTGGYGSFQIHNHESFVSTSETQGNGGETIFAINKWAGNVEFGMGNNTSGNGSPDWTFNTGNRSNYSDITMYAIVKSAYAPGMKNVANAGEYTMAQAFSINDPVNARMNPNGTSYFIDNTAQMQADGVMFDRVGYYMEYINPANPEDLYYAFVSMDAFQLSGKSTVDGVTSGWMQDITKIGAPDSTTNTMFQQYVKNLEITTNLPSSEGRLTLAGATDDQRSGTARIGFLEFWASNYGTDRTADFPHGSNGSYNTNDSGGGTGSGHGSMQIHNIDTGETVIALGGFNQSKQFGIGTSTSGHSDWTSNTSKSGYQVANMYMFVRESDAALATLDAKGGMEFYQRNDSGQAVVDISGNWIAKTDSTISQIQAFDGHQWVTLNMDGGGAFDGSLTLDSGWHYVDVRALDAGGNVLTSTTTNKIGVGEIFITAGQSNSTNCGDGPGQVTTSGNVVALNLQGGFWQVANDPQPVFDGSDNGVNDGSTWPSFGDKLSEKLGGVPVGVVSVGWSGSAIGRWNPTGNDLYNNLKMAIDALDGDFAAILWHQGESDRGNSTVYYQDALEALIAASRDDAGWEELPWVIALVSADANGNADTKITDAQKAVIEGDLYAFLGPDSDWVKSFSEYRGEGTNGIHFSEAGLEYMGELWADAVYNLVSIRQQDTSATPEPATWVMLLLGTAGIVVWRRKKS